MLIGIVALVVIGPERLPAVAKTAGQWIAKLQRFVRGVKTDLASELDSGDLKKLIGDQRDQIDELKKMMNTAKQDFETSTKDVVGDAKSRMNELETSVTDKPASPSSSSASAGAAAVGSAVSSQSVTAMGPTASDSSTGGADQEAATTEFETLDGQGVSLDSNKDSDIGRTGS